LDLLTRVAAGWRALVLVMTLLALPLPARATTPPATELVQAELLAEPSAVSPGQPFWVGLRLRIKDHWHVYWRNPGDSGEAVAINWNLPAGFEAGPIVWPTPARIPVAHLVNFGYEHEVVLLTRITPPPAVEGTPPLSLKANATWLVCERECVPGEASLSLGLPIAASGTPSEPQARMREVFDAARAKLPQPSPWNARLQIGPDTLTLDVAASGMKRERIASAFFFPRAETMIQHAAPQPLEVAADRLSLSLQRSQFWTGTPSDGGGVLVIEEALGGTTARQAFDLANVVVAEGPPAGRAEAASLAVILQAAVLALVGGIILNLMPCVFPVLSLKVLGLMEQSGGERHEVRRHGFAYTAGVLATFAVLGGVLIGLRAAGAEAGWGFQLQSPLTIVVLAYVLFAVALSLSGVFYLGSSLQTIGGRFAPRSGLAGSFSTGVLAAVVATPCTAPFMATAVGFALTQPAPVAMTVILALGLGLALPFLALTLAPHLVSRLPRPGQWMETFKQALAFPIYATVAWLIWVLAQQVGSAGLFAALIGLVLIGLSAWSFNATRTASPWGRRLAGGVVAASLAGAAVAIAGVSGSGSAAPPSSAAASASANHEPFSQKRLGELRATDRLVFVNMTAAWCITCLVNEQAALSNAAVRAAFADRNIAYLKGDWTRRNPEITRVLEEHGRSGVPLYLLFAGNAKPVLLPQILTPAIVLAEIDRISEPRQRRASLPTTKKE
jgi:thiol:disulfide interchange protein DsbD